MKTYRLRSGETPFVKMAAGETVTLELHLFDLDPAQRGKALDLTGKTVAVTARPRGCCGSPDLNAVPLFSRDATVADPTTGIALLVLAVVDTDGKEGDYALDVWAKTTANGARTQMMPVGELAVSTPATLPDGS